MNGKIKNKHIDDLFKAVLKLKDMGECYMFFEDICTVGELNAIAQRLEVAKMLQKGCKYSDISQKTGASAATISRVNRCLNYGADGYKMILERLDKENGEEKC